MSGSIEKEQIARYFTHLEITEDGVPPAYQTGLIVAADKKKVAKNPAPVDVIVLTCMDDNNTKGSALKSVGMKFNFPGYKDVFTEGECFHSKVEYCDSSRKNINILLYRLQSPQKLLPKSYVPYPHFSNPYIQLMTERGCLVWLSKIHVPQVHEINNVDIVSQEFMLESCKYEDESARFRTASSSKSGGMGQAISSSDYHKTEAQIKGIISAFVFNEEGKLAGMVVSVNRSSSVTSGINVQYHALNFWHDMGF